LPAAINPATLSWHALSPLWPLVNLADFARKGQLANYEGLPRHVRGTQRPDVLPNTGIITWMSNPAQPSFVWQALPLRRRTELFPHAVQSASEPIHIQFNEATGHIQIVNNTPVRLRKAVAHIAVYSL